MEDGSNFRLRVLQAQTYRELTYRFSGDESFQFSSEKVAARRAEFYWYKELANKYYDTLAAMSKRMPMIING